MRMIGRLACQVDGSGPPLIFITGLGGHADYWYLQVKHFSDRFTCMTYDHPGIGQSPRAPTPYSIAGWAQEVLHLADALGFSQFALVGHSTGGAVAQHLAAHAPERVSAVCLSGTWACADTRFKTIFALRYKLLTAGDTDAYAVLGSILTRPLVWPEAKAARGNSGSDVSVTLARIEALLAHDSRGYLRQIVAPTLVCSAADDVLVPDNHGRQLTEAIRAAKLRLFKQGGHHFPQTQSIEFNQALSGLLRPA
jgi:aminoacrylate hydrolase